MEVQGTTLRLSPPLQSSSQWIAQPEPFRQLLAAWQIMGADDPAMVPRLVGAPGLGKTTLALAVAKSFGNPLFLMQCTSDTRPEDLVVHPVLSQDGKIAYHASPLLTAVLVGGTVVLDEGNRMPEKSWASLAGLLDHRRTIESVIAGITVSAHPEFRCVVTMNEDASTFEVPEYILSRLQPTIELPFPDAQSEREILSHNAPKATEDLLSSCVHFLQKAHALDLSFSIRDGISILRYAHRLMDADGSLLATQAFENSVRHVLGRDAFRMEDLARQRSQFSAGTHGFEPENFDTDEFFFGDEDDDLRRK